MVSSVPLLRTFTAVISGSLMTAMRLFMWRPSQKGVVACLLQSINLMNFWTELFCCVPSALLAERKEFNLRIF